MAKDQYKYFRIEAQELLESLNQTVLELERDENRTDALGRLLRLAHTLKGASRVVKQPGIAELAHQIEDAFDSYRDGQKSIPQECTGRVLTLLDQIAAKVASLDSPKEESQRAVQRPTGDGVFETVRVEIAEMDTLLHDVSEASVQLKTLSSGLRTLDQVGRLTSRLLDALSLHLGSETVENASTGNLSKIHAIAENLRERLHELERNLTGAIDQVEAEFSQVRDGANRLRLLPAATVFPSLERATRDAAQALHKQVAFETVGGASRLDAYVLAALRDALLHVVRNAVAHGIESSVERVAAQKPASGHIQLRIEQRGNRVSFLCCDDGRGIDLEAIRRVAIHRGLIKTSDANSFGFEQAVQMLLHGGITTKSGVDEVSGRGIGLDVVRETADRLKGDVTVRSEPGKGTSLEICVPVSLFSVAALKIDVGGSLVAIPLDSVRQTIRVENAEIVHSAGNDSLVYEGSTIPFLNLPGALGRKDLKRGFWSVVIVEASSNVAAIGAQRLLGTATIVVRPLPSLAAAAPILAGACFNAEGDPELVLDPHGLVDAARSARAVPFENPKKRPSVLVIDDSLTTRMLEQNILESAGYEVEVATSGEEGLEKAQAKQYGLFLVDVEMPGMDGFEFVSRARADANLSSIPSILVTSRNAAEDRRRGEQAGARAYIVKGEFDQSYLLRMTRELIG